MPSWLKHVHGRELRFVAVILANLVCAAGYLASSVGVRPEESGGWRRIDLDAVEARMEAGELVRKEADWYHPFSQEGSPRP
jgi:hypothetical protein